MKYYLFIGYHTIEKFLQYAKIQVHLGDRLLEEFPADSTDVTNIFHNTTIDKDTTLLDTLYHARQPKVVTIKKINRVKDRSMMGRGDAGEIKIINEKELRVWESRGWIKSNDKPESSYTVNTSQPKKIKVIEIDSTEFEYANITNLKIKVVGGPSNNTNGFITKRNMVILFPIFLIPQFCFDLNVVIKYFNMAKKNFLSNYKLNSYPFYFKNTGEEPRPRHDRTYFIPEIPIQWPGPNFIPKKVNGKNCFLFGEPIGNDCEFNFFVHKKHKIYMLHTSINPPIGKWQLNLCFVNLYEKLVRQSNKKFGKWSQRFLNLEQWNFFKNCIENNDEKIKREIFNINLQKLNAEKKALDK